MHCRGPFGLAPAVGIVLTGVTQAGVGAGLTTDSLLGVGGRSAQGAPAAGRQSGGSYASDRASSGPRVSFVMVAPLADRSMASYRVVVQKGSKTLLTKTVLGSKLELVVKKKQLADGVDKGSVWAVNSKGTGPAASTTFWVKK